MKRSISLWQLIGFAFTSLAGTLLHFLYDWTGQSIFAAPFSGVNESTWEHMKLLFWPMFLFSLLERRLFPEYKNFWCVKLVGILVGLTLIPVLFYTLNGVFGETPDRVNISIFFVAAAVAYLLEARLFKKESLTCRSPWHAFLAICLIAVSFVLFTFRTPELPIFEDPITGRYGLQS
ncbi:MAG: hypothetical protein IIU58_03630 [Clostridia bacterium]|nr:hypothetical protein [Clostridia bacterium]